MYSNLCCQFLFCFGWHALNDILFTSYNISEILRLLVGCMYILTFNSLCPLEGGILLHTTHVASLHFDCEPNTNLN